MPTQNPLLEKPKNKFGVVEFAKIKPEHFIPAVDMAIAEAAKNIKAITESTEPPNFQNTIEALEVSGENVDQVSETYFNLFSAEAGEDLQKLAGDISQKLSHFSSDTLLNATLFQKVKAIYHQKEKLNLDTEQIEILDKTYKTFTRNGALLGETQKEYLRKIDEELAALNPKFSENVLKSTNAFELILTKEEAKGIPESALEGAQEAAKAKGKDGYLFNLQAPSLIPLLTYCDDRKIREKVWRAYNSRSLHEPYSNIPVLLRITKLRHERAKLLGFESHAHFILEERMASTPEEVNAFLKKILETSRGAAEREFSDLQAFAKKTTGHFDLKAWDYSYYAEKLKKAQFDFDEEELRPYFSLDKVIDGVFKVASKLYNLEFKETSDVPKYHQDVRTYEVLDKKTNRHLGIFMADFFPRETKKSGAWMTNYRDQGLFHGKVERPVVSIVCNFTKPTATKPSLLPPDEVKTLFHEFGHALHSLLSDCHYRSVAGPKVYWDFVELPSQIMENWVTEKETLDLFASHYQTGEKIPQSLIDKLVKSEKFHAGWFSLRQVNFCLIDMAWHQGPLPDQMNVEKFEEEVTQSSSFFPKEPGTSISSAFSHIFAGGYSAGYYSYKWAEVLDADAFEYFKEKGIFNPEVSNKFRNEILAKGGSEHPMVLYKRFRGREPDPNALFRREGLT
ncbi:MAG: peptidase M3 [Proteobacteria bacterium SG_bin7]|nr:MAG: peptidase M3 [Proteobacteria bacterium SG_bin7]